LAAARMAAEAPGHTLDATALVHEAYLRLVGDQQFDGRGHFFAAAAEAMRRILIERARHKQSLKAGGGFRRHALSDIARLLSTHAPGDPQAARELLPLVYDELRRLAAQRLAQEKPGQTLQATALVHEAYLRLVDTAEAQRWNSRGHFFAAAAEAMRRILVDAARGKRAQKRGGGCRREEVDVAELAAAPADEKLLALDEALTKLERQHPAKAQLVKLRYFAGLSTRAAAEALGVSTATADRYWAYARAWLQREMNAGPEPR